MASLLYKKDSRFTVVGRSTDQSELCPSPPLPYQTIKNFNKQILKTQKTKRGPLKLHLSALGYH